MSSSPVYNNSSNFLDFRSGREEGFNYFFNEYYKSVYFFASRYVSEKPAVEDIVTDSFIKLWDKREIFDTESGLKGYLYKTVYNACLRWLQQKQNRSMHIRSYSNQIDTIEQACFHNIVKAETINLLYKAIQQLPSQCKKIFTKLYIEGKSVCEIADEMNLTVSTIKNQKARGIKLLKPRLST
jgi:RNA polymerase sigma-70 factor (ECF subfamily)